MKPPVRRRIFRIAGFTLAGLLGLIGVVLAAAILFLQGPRMGAFVGKVLPDMRGHMVFTSVYWKPRLLLDLIRKQPTPLVVDGLKIIDPEGTVVLDVPHLTVGVELHQLINGAGLFLHDLEVSPKSHWRFGRMVKTKGIGFLAALDPKNPSPPKPRPADAPPEKGFAVHIFNAQLHGLRVVFDFPHVWGFDLKELRGPASLAIDDGLCLWDAQNLETSEGGYLTVLDQVLPFDSVSVKRVATLREYSDDIFLELAAGRTGRTVLKAKGFFNGIYASDSVSAIHLGAEFLDAPDALNAVLKRMNLPGLKLDGEHARVAAELMGPYVSIGIKTDITGLDVEYGDYAAKNLTLHTDLAFDPKSKAPAPNTELHELSFSPPDGGRFVLQTSLKNSQLATQLRFDRFTTNSYLPASLRRMAAGKLHGKLAARAKFSDAMDEVKSFSLDKLDLAFERTGSKAALPRSLRVSGQAAGSPTSVASSGLRIEVPGGDLEVRGKVDLAKHLIALGLQLTASHLPDLLASLKAPPVAKSATLSLDVGGTFEAPEANGHLVVKDIGGVSGIPPVGQLDSHFGLKQGTAQLDAKIGPVAAGSITANGRTQIFEKTLAHLLKSPTLDFQLQGRDIALESLVAGGIVSGKVAFDVVASGTVAKPHLRIQVPAGVTVQVLGQAWAIGGIDIEADKQGLLVRMIDVKGPAGGDIAIEGRLGLADKAMPIDWRIRITNMPIASILAAAQVDAPVSGQLAVDLHVSGTTKAPLLEGSISLAQVKAMGISLGDGLITLATQDQQLTVMGELFKLFRIDGAANFGPGGPQVTATVGFDHLVIEDLVTDLRVLGGHAAISGQVGVEWRPDRPLRVDARLTELAASIMGEGKSADGQSIRQPIGIHTVGDLHVVVSGDHIVLDRVQLSTDGGRFVAEGELNGDRVRAMVRGRLRLELLQPLLAGKLDKLAGAVGLEVNVDGTLKRPVLNGKLAIARPVVLRPAKTDSESDGETSVAAPEISIPSGTVLLASDSVELQDLVVSVDGSTLRLGGRVGLTPDFAPTTLALQADGEVSAALLSQVANDSVSDVSGKARIKARVGGTMAKPDLAARIDLGEIQMRVRGFNGRIEVESGAVELTTRELLLTNIKLRVNEDGRVRLGADGEPGRVHILSLNPFQLGEIGVPLSGERLAYRSPAIVIDDLSFTMAVRGDMRSGLGLSGDVRLNSGRYLQDFNVAETLSPASRIDESGSSGDSEEQPLVDNLKLNLRVRTVGDSFIVQNNLAPEIRLDVDLAIAGTPRFPTIEGRIRPTEGRFHVMGLRGNFELVQGANSIIFVPTKKLGSDTPELSLRAENLMTDASGREHKVIMSITGPVDRAAVDLTTSEGLNRNQTLMLLLTGRTMEAINGGGRVFGLNPQSATEMLGQPTRDAVENLIEPYVDDTLHLLTGDIVNLRPSVGSDGIQMKALAQASREFNLEMSYLRGFQSQQRYRAQGSLWLRDYSTLRLVWDRLSYYPSQGILEERQSLRLELTLDFPIRSLNP